MSSIMFASALCRKKTDNIPSTATKAVDTYDYSDFMNQALMNGLSGNYAKGKKFYDANCAECHGIKGDGDGPRAYFIFPKPRNFLAESSRTRLNRNVVFNATKYGVRGKEMPAWGKVIDDQKIADVVEYVVKAMIQGDKVK